MNPPLTVLHLFSSSALGGTEAISAVALGGMAPAGFAHHVVFLDHNGAALPLYEPFAKTVQLLGTGQLWRLPAQAPRLISLTRRVRPQAVLCYGFRANLLWRMCRALSATARQPASVLMLRGLKPMDNPSAALTRLDRFTFGGVDFVLSNSQAALDQLKADGYPPRPAVVAHNGLDAARYATHPDKTALRQQLGLPPAAPLVLCAANLRPVKNHALLLRAFARALPRHPTARLLLAGRDDGPGESLRALAGQLGVAQSVDFLGLRRDMPLLLQAADVFALASDHEGMSGAMMEAMAADLPVVATRVGGAAELVVEGQTGLLVDRGDEDALASALSRYLDDPALATAHGAAGRARVREHFSLAAMTTTWQTAITQAVRAKNAPAVQATSNRRFNPPAR